MSLSGHQRAYEGKTNDWLTPPEIISALGPFDLDPCASLDQARHGQPWPTAHRMLCELDDGLCAPWAPNEFVWCNPPFGPHAASWLERLAAHRNGIALVPARTETRWFRTQIWNSAESILFLHNRPHFHFPDGRRAPFNSGAPIVLVGTANEEF